MRDPGIRDNRSTEIQVGILVLLSLILLVLGVFWISNTRFGGPTLQLHGVAGASGQLQNDAPILLLGVNVGQVDNVRLDGFSVHMELNIFHDAALPTDTRAVISAAGFLGNQMVELLPGASSRLLVSGDTIRVGGGSDLMALADDLGGEASTVLGRISEALSEETVEDIRGSSAAFASAMRELESLLVGERDALHSLIDGLGRTAENMASATGGAELERTLVSLDSLTLRLKESASGLDSTTSSLAVITSRLEEGEGTLGKLLTDERLYEDLRAAVENVQVATEEIALLARDLREQPEKYLQGLKVSVF